MLFTIVSLNITSPLSEVSSVISITLILEPLILFFVTLTALSHSSHLCHGKFLRSTIQFPNSICNCYFYVILALQSFSSLE